MNPRTSQVLRRRRPAHVLVMLLIGSALPIGQAWAQTVRARDLGVPFQGITGPLNAITDVGGVEVGHTTLISGDSANGQPTVRTGVTAVLPRGKESTVPTFGGWFALNGNGEMTGTTWLKESGVLEGPVMITNTLSVGVVHHGVIRWGVERARRAGASPGPYVAALPVIAETWDGTLNDIYGQHVTEAHAIRALETATGGRVVEGNVGGGTGMICHQFKGGIGTSSRVVEVRDEKYIVGVLVQCNFGSRELFEVTGVPVGREIPDLMPARPDAAKAPGHSAAAATAGDDTDDTLVGRDGSIIVVLATDAPLLPHQLERLARRVSLGLGRTGSIASNGSGDIFVAFSTANPDAAGGQDRAQLAMVPNAAINALFSATIFATEEAIINAVVAAETMTGLNGTTVHALPHDRLREALRKYNREAGKR